MSLSSYAAQETNYLFWKRFAQGKLKTHVSSVKVRIPSPKEILSWSERRLPNSTLVGKIDNAHTVEHDTLRPVSGGLFCERIFGPIATNVCACLRKKGWNEDFCKTCEVQFTKSRLRRYQMGHILLSAPVIHIWALQGGYLATLLGKKNFGIRSIAYGKVMCQSKPKNYLFSNKFSKVLLSSSESLANATSLSLLNGNRISDYQATCSSETQPVMADPLARHIIPKQNEFGSGLQTILQKDQPFYSDKANGYECDSRNAKNLANKVFKTRAKVERKHSLSLSVANKLASQVNFTSEKGGNYPKFQWGKPKVTPFLAEKFCTNYSLYGKKYYEFQKQRYLENHVLKNPKHFVYERGNVLPFYQFVLYKPDTFKKVSQFFDSSNKQKFALPLVNYSIQKLLLPFFYKNIKSSIKSSISCLPCLQSTHNHLLWKRNQQGFNRTYFLSSKINKSNVSTLTSTAFALASSSHSPLWQNKATDLFAGQTAKHKKNKDASNLQSATVLQNTTKSDRKLAFNFATLLPQEKLPWIERINGHTNSLQNTSGPHVSALQEDWSLPLAPPYKESYRKKNQHANYVKLPETKNRSLKKGLPSVLSRLHDAAHGENRENFFSSILQEEMFHRQNFGAFDGLDCFNWATFYSGELLEQSKFTDLHFPSSLAVHSKYLKGSGSSIFVKNESSQKPSVIDQEEELFSSAPGLQNLPKLGAEDNNREFVESKLQGKMQGKTNFLSTSLLYTKDLVYNYDRVSNNFRFPNLFVPKQHSNKWFKAQPIAFTKGEIRKKRLPFKDETFTLFRVFRAYGGGSYGHSHSAHHNDSNKNANIGEARGWYTLETANTKEEQLCRSSFIPYLGAVAGVGGIAKQTWNFNQNKVKPKTTDFPKETKNMVRATTNVSFVSLGDTNLIFERLDKGSHLELPQSSENFVKRGPTGPAVLLESLNTLNLILLEDLVEWKWEQGKTRLDSFLLQNKLTKRKRGLRNKVAKTKIILTRRKKLIQSFVKTKQLPEWMVLQVLPVLPPALRPILELEPNNVVVSDLNILYQTVIRRNDALMGLLTFRALEIDILNRQVSLQQSIEKLFDKGAGTKKRPLKSLSQGFHGKKGLFRLHLLGKRVDYSGRSVIVVGPQLKLHECGLPKAMALVLFLPFLIARLKIKKIAHNTSKAKQLIIRKDKQIWRELRALIYSHPVLLNRAPTLHRLGFQAFQPILVSGKAIILPALVCTGFNADFDGDQMAVHVPLSYAARAESWKLLYAKNNMLSPATGKSVIGLSQEMILGCYSSTLLINKTHSLSISKLGSPLITNKYRLLCTTIYFSTLQEIHKALNQNKIALQTPIWLRLPFFEDNGGLEEPLEIRLNTMGHFFRLYGQSQRCFSKKIKSESQILGISYIRTSAGRIQLNETFYSSIR